MNSANDCKFLAGAVQHHKHAWHRSQHPRTVNLVPHFCKHLARLHGSRRNLGARAAARGTPGLPSLWCRAEKQHPTARLPRKVPSWSRSRHLLPGMTPVLEGPPQGISALACQWAQVGTQRDLGSRRRQPLASAKMLNCKSEQLNHDNHFSFTPLQYLNKSRLKSRWYSGFIFIIRMWKLMKKTWTLTHALNQMGRIKKPMTWQKGNFCHSILTK